MPVFKPETTNLWMAKSYFCSLKRVVQNCGGRYKRPLRSKENDLSIGSYPEIRLAQARAIREE